MRILNVIMSIDPVTGGGTAKRTVKIAQYLARAGVESSLLTSDIGVDEKLCNSLSDVKLHILKNLYSRFYIFRFSFKCIARIVAQADVVHLMNHWTLLNALVYRECLHTGKPYVVCPAGAMEIFGRSVLLKKLYNLLVGRHMIRNAAGHIAIPRAEKTAFKRYGIPPEKVTVIPNGVDAAEFQNRDTGHFRRKYDLGDNPFIFFIGRLSYEKGPDLLIDAFSRVAKKYRDYHLVVAGPDDGMLEELVRKSRSLRLDTKIHFTGYLGSEEKSQALHAATLLVVPSRKEAMSIVALEAGAAGVPVLMTDICGFDQVADINGGQIVTASKKGIYEGLNHMLADPGALVSMGNNLEKTVLSEYTWQAVARQYINLYEHILRVKN